MGRHIRNYTSRGGEGPPHPQGEGGASGGGCRVDLQGGDSYAGHCDCTWTGGRTPRAVTVAPGAYPRHILSIPYGIPTGYPRIHPREPALSACQGWRYGSAPPRIHPRNTHGSTHGGEVRAWCGERFVSGSAPPVSAAVSGC